MILSRYRQSKLIYVCNGYKLLINRKLSMKPTNNIATVPNAITLARIVSSPLITVAIMHDMKMAVLVGCVAAAFSDFLDGYIARNYNQKSNLGSFLDPLADKIFIGSIGAGLASQNIIPIELFGTIVARDVTIVGIAFALRAWEKPTNAGFFDFTKTTIDFVPSNLSKANTGVQFALIVGSLSSFIFGHPGSAIVDSLCTATYITTIGSGLHYLSGIGIRYKGFKMKTKKFTWRDDETM